MIALFTDFGRGGPYVGQLHAVFAREADAPPVIDLMHDAPCRDPRAAAHLLAALAPWFPAGTLFVAVVDPGVGTGRRPLAVEADGQWFIGPDNGLLDVVSARATGVRWWCIDRPPDSAYATFYGRDLFAPVAAAIARGEPVPGHAIDPAFAAGAGGDLAEVVYVDDFGNAMTGLRAQPGDAGSLSVAGTALAGARTFADAAPGEAVWLVNSVGLVEIAVNGGSAAGRLALEIGSRVHWDARRSSNG